MSSTTAARRTLVKLAGALFGLAAAALWSGAAQAQCSASGTTAVMTPTTTEEIQAMPQDYTLGTEFTCSGPDISLLSGDFIIATFMTSANNGSLVDAISGGSIGYSLYADSGYTMPITPNQQFDFSSFTLISLFSGPSGDIPVYLRTATPNVPAGTYTDTIPVRWQWQVCIGIEAAGICVGSLSTGDEVVNLSVTLTVDAVCSIAAQSVYDFGQASFIEDIGAIPVPFQVSCSRDLSFDYYFDGGSNYTGGWRRMMNGAEAIQYGIYLADGVTPVGPTLANAVAATGTGMFENYNLSASVNPSQGPVPPGVYQDQVLIVVEF